MFVNSLKRNDPGYPSNLLDIDSPPAALYYIGANPEEWLDRPKVAIVGSRKATAYGLSVARQLSSQLASSGVVIISGLAFGIDSAAHQAAIEAGGITVAVMGTGLDQIYPVSHLQLAKDMTASGGSLLSEYPAGSPTYRQHFLVRNRLISGLADAVIIIEAARHSGSLHTARFGLEQGKTVMAVPGNIDRPSHEGCNNLIKSGAVPVTGVEDVFLALGISPKRRQSQKSLRLPPEEQLVYGYIRQSVADQEALAEATKIDPANLNRILTALELGGVIRPTGAGRWTTL